MESFENIFKKKSLTRKPQMILEAIVFLIRKGQLPTVREVGELVGLRSPATVLKHLRVLEQTGLISLSGKSRGIRIADQELLEQVLRPEDPATTRHDPRKKEDPPQDGVSSRVEGEILQAHLPQAARFGQRYGLRRDRAGHSSGIALMGAIAAGQPFESYAEGFEADRFSQESDAMVSQQGVSPQPLSAQQSLAIDPTLFAQSGELFALQIQGDSMIGAGILDGDYVIIRRQNEVEEGEIAAVLIDGEGTLKRWTSSSSGDYLTESDEDGAGSDADSDEEGRRREVRLLPENERFDSIEIGSDEGKDVLVIGKYIGLVRGELQLA